MTGHARTYRALVRLYPSGFRREYRDDLVQAFCDLLARDGAARAWGRTAVDLSVTVPRYRLETIMTSATTTFALQLTIAALTLGAVLSYLTGVYPGVALLLLVLAIAIAVSQRSRLARAVREPDPDRRRRLLRLAASLFGLCIVGSAAMFVELSGDEQWHGGKLVAYNAFFFATLLGAVGTLVAGLRTPRQPMTPGRTVAA
ncbi:MAG TPA: hypothetical protein VFZ83_02370 [Acidimicrobiia bacterium]|nr:hypothetical protein [Acidimicrobiia bacterium]